MLSRRSPLSNRWLRRRRLPGLGCIPTKALLTGTQLVESLRERGSAFGICADPLSLDYGRALDHIRKVADHLRAGVESLFRKNRLEVLRGRARLADPAAGEIAGEDDKQQIEARHIVLAIGSCEWASAIVTVDGRRVVTSREASGSPRLWRHASDEKSFVFATTRVGAALISPILLRNAGYGDPSQAP